MSDCVLSPADKAFSTMLSAFVGSVVLGVSSGPFNAFGAGAIAWVSVLRVLASSFWEFYLALIGKESEVDKRSGLRINDGVTPLGWVGWFWAILYTPISQTVWVVDRFGKEDQSGIKLARAIAIGVSALGLALDNKHRYAEELGRWKTAFKVWHATVCLWLGVMSAMLLLKGALELQLDPGPTVGYTIGCVVSAGVSFLMLPVVDGTWKYGDEENFFVDYVVGLLIGGLVGLAVAAPAFTLWSDARFDAYWRDQMGKPKIGMDLQDYLDCRGVTIVQKWAAILP